MSKPLGELNGKYALLFKVNMILLPIIFASLLTWGIWVTGSIYTIKGFVEYGPRFSHTDAAALADKLMEHVEDHYVRKE